MLLKCYLILNIAAIITLGDAVCRVPPSPSIPLPVYSVSDPILVSAFKNVSSILNRLVSSPNFDNTTSMSIEITSSKETLWEWHYSGLVDPNPRKAVVGNTAAQGYVDGESVFRIASVTKVFTVLGILQLHAEGVLNLDDPVDMYISELKKQQQQGAKLPWKDITLRSLAGQLSGIPRDWSQGDLFNRIADPTTIGLPPSNNTSRPTCYEFSGYSRTCNVTDLFAALRHLLPVYAPNAVSTYSNTNYEMLGLVIENVTSMSYADYITSTILKPLNMTQAGASFSAAPALAGSHAILPFNQSSYFNVEMGIHDAAGGMYASSSSLSTFLRYILTHYNGLHTGENWLQPSSFGTGAHTYYGMPWEIFRTCSRSLLPWQDGKCVTFNMKTGGLPGYVSVIVVVPEYDLGFTILTAGGNGAGVSTQEAVAEVIAVALTQAADKISMRQITASYAGEYRADNSSGLNSSLTLTQDSKTGLSISRWISNGTDVLTAFRRAFPSVFEPGHIARLIPTLLYIDEENKQGERWRMVFLPPPRPSNASENAGPVLDDLCITDVDIARYDGLPLNEFVFWGGNVTQQTQQVEPTAFKVRLVRVETENVGENVGKEKRQEESDPEL